MATPVAANVEVIDLHADNLELLLDFLENDEEFEKNIDEIIKEVVILILNSFILATG